MGLVGAQTAVMRVQGPVARMIIAPDSVKWRMCCGSAASEQPAAALEEIVQALRLRGAALEQLGAALE